MSRTDQGYQRLLAASNRFIETSSHTALGVFRDHFPLSSHAYIRPDASPHNVRHQLKPALSMTNALTRDLTELFNEFAENLHWEQSYKRGDGVGQDMLNGYAFVEITGIRGPYINHHLRSGIGVWGPNIDYPRHQHKAQEVYAVLAGSAEFTVGGSPTVIARAGDMISVDSFAPHSFQTLNEPLVVFYLWQSGDLREKSSFS
ncbi:MAG: dimethylsulfonioproprionate lyase family protein [Pseudomonadota bacterium]